MRQISHLNTLKIGFIGAGNMAEAIIRGVLATGLNPDQILISDPDEARTESLSEALAVQAIADNQQLVSAVDVAVLAVKPQIMEPVLSAVAAVCTAAKPLLISVAAGIPLSLLREWSGAECAVVRSMPNTPALIGAGMSGLYAGAQVSAAQRQISESIMRAVGKVVWVDDEALIDSVTAVSGSGPAYFFLMIEALESAAIEQGLSPADARTLAIETAYGAASLAREAEDPASVLRERVTSPGGTTEAALKHFAREGFIPLVGGAVAAAANRSRTLAEEAEIKANNASIGG